MISLSRFLLFATTMKNTNQKGTGSVSKAIRLIQDCHFFSLILPADNVTFANCPTTIKLCGAKKKHNARLQCNKHGLLSDANQCVVM